MMMMMMMMMMALLLVGSGRGAATRSRRDERVVEPALPNRDDDVRSA